MKFSVSGFAFRVSFPYVFIQVHQISLNHYQCNEMIIIKNDGWRKLKNDNCDDDNSDENHGYRNSVNFIRPYIIIRKIFYVYQGPVCLEILEVMGINIHYGNIVFDD